MLYILMLPFLFIPKESWSITLDEIKSLSIQHSSLLTAQEMERRALENETMLKSRWQNPQLMSQLGTLKTANIQGATSEFSITQAVPLSDRYSIKREIAQLALHVHEKNQEFQKKWIEHQAVLSAWRVYVTEELHKHGKERAGRLAILKQYMQTRARLSPRQRVELNLISNNLVQMESEQDRKQHELNLALRDLSFWIGKEINSKELELNIPAKIDGLSFPETDIENDMEIKLSNSQVRSSSLEQKLASKERLPDLFLGAGHRIEDVTPRNNFSYGIIGLNIPIWDTGSYKLEAASARLKRDEKYQEETYRKVQLKQDRQRELIRHSLALLKRFPKSMIAQNEKAISEAENAFKQGVLDANTFIQTENQSHELIDQVYLVWMGYLENLSSLQLMQLKELQWNK